MNDLNVKIITMKYGLAPKLHEFSSLSLCMITLIIQYLSIWFSPYSQHMLLFNFVVLLDKEKELHLTNTFKMDFVTF